MEDVTFSEDGITATRNSDGKTFQRNGQVRFRAEGPLVLAESYASEDGETFTVKSIAEAAPDPLA